MKQHIAYLLLASALSGFRPIVHVGNKPFENVYVSSFLPSLNGIGRETHGFSARYMCQTLLLHRHAHTQYLAFSIKFLKIHTVSRAQS